MLDVYDKQWRFLTKSAFLDKISHAYLFSGPEVLSKQNLARKFSRLINCQASNRAERPCLDCRSCREFQKNCHPDFFWLEPAEKGSEENEADLIRELSRWLSLRPCLGKYKIAVIDQFEAFSAPAQSALLKTLEEPPGNAVLILLCRQPDLVLPTILSRTQEIRLYGRKIQDPAGLRAEKERLAEFVSLPANDLAGAFRKIRMLSEDRQKAVLALEEWMSFLRVVLLSRLLVEQDHAWPEAFRTAKAWPVKKVWNFLSSGQNTILLLTRTNVSCQLALENLFLELT